MDFILTALASAIGVVLANLAKVITQLWHHR